MAHLDRFADPKSLPTSEDIIKVRQKTSGECLRNEKLMLQELLKQNLNSMTLTSH